MRSETQTTRSTKTQYGSMLFREERCTFGWTEMGIHAKYKCTPYVIPLVSSAFFEYMWRTSLISRKIEKDNTFGRNIRIGEMAHFEKRAGI